MATITENGAIPDSPATLRANLLTAATALSPSLTANLPASLIEDMASTGTGALVVQDQAYVDAINSIAPTTANDEILIQLGNVYGVPRGLGSNASVYVTFTGTVGFVINAGFIVSDGTYQYTTQEAAVVPTGGTTDPVYCVATKAGSWAIPAASVTSLSTSVPSGITLTVTNPNAGTVGQTAQSINDYRLQVIQAGRAVATGSATFIKTALQKVSGVIPRTISIRYLSGIGTEIVVAGGDPYKIANAIFQSMFNIRDLVGKQTIGTTQTITVKDYPDNYQIKFVTPTSQAVTVAAYWTTVSGTNFVSNTVVSSAVIPAITAYINSINIGEKMSLLDLQDTFVAATASILDPTTIATLGFVVTIAGTTVSPSGMIYSASPVDSEAYLTASTITVSNTTPP